MNTGLNFGLYYDLHANKLTVHDDAVIHCDLLAPAISYGSYRDGASWKNIGGVIGRAIDLSSGGNGIDFRVNSGSTAGTTHTLAMSLTRSQLTVNTSDIRLPSITSGAGSHFLKIDTATGRIYYD